MSVLSTLRGRRPAPSNRPLLAIDVDGVVSLYGFDEPPEGPATRLTLVDGTMHCISLPTGDLLRRLSEHYDLVWATGWEARANTYLCQLLGIQPLPFLTFNGDASFGTAHWKLGPLGKYGRGRRIAWIDDCFDEQCYEWARSRREPTLLIPTEPHLGMEEVHVEALTAWAGGRVEGSRPTGPASTQPRAAYARPAGSAGRRGR